jgi:hypothetical protein
MGIHLRPLGSRGSSTSRNYSIVVFPIVVFNLVIIVVKRNPIFLVLIPNGKPFGFLELVQAPQGHPLVDGNPPMPLWVVVILDRNPHALLEDGN